MSRVRAEARSLPPDGGYGWVVVGACAASNLVVPPLAAVFGLLLVEAAPSLGGLSAGAAALALCLHAGCARLLRAPAPALLRALGSRGAALCGALIAAAGLALTALGTTPAAIVFFYGLVNSLGVALLTSAFTSSMDSFFSENRSIAFAITSLCASLGTVYMPLLVSALMAGWGWRHALLVLAALCLASLLSAGLLRPAERYCKAPNTQEAALNKDPANGVPDIVATTLTINAIPSIARLEELIEDDLRLNKAASLATLASAVSIQEKNVFYHTELRDSERNSTDNIICTVGESQEVDDRSMNIEMTNLHDLRTIEEVPGTTTLDVSKSDIMLYLNKLSRPRLISSLGLSLAWCAEAAFSLLLPLVAGELLGLQTPQVALVLAARGAAETLYRLLAPSIGEWCHKTPRQIHVIALMMTVFARIMLLLPRSFLSTVLVAVALGAAAGLRGRRRGGEGGGAGAERTWQALLDGVGVVLLGAATGCGRSWCGSWRPPVLGLCAATLAGAGAACGAAACGEERGALEPERTPQAATERTVEKRHVRNSLTRLEIMNLS